MNWILGNTKVVVRQSDWAASAVRGFRFSEPSALAAGFGADDATYSVIVKRQTIRAQRTSIGRTTNSQRPQLRDPWLTPAAHKARYHKARYHKAQYHKAQYHKAQYHKAQYPKNSRPANKHWTNTSSQRPQLQDLWLVLLNQILAAALVFATAAFVTDALND